MAVSRRDCATRRGGHCVTNTGSGFSCVISTITNREYAGDQWSPFFIVSSAITGRDAATTVLAGASVRLQKEVLVDYRLERLLHGGVEAELTQLAHALDGRAAPGEHTAFMSAIGCSELFIASAPLPITVAVAISSAIGLANSARTPASARASMYIKTNAPDAPPRAPNAGNRSSSIWYTLYALPTDENIASAVFICALVAALPPYIAVTETFYT